MSFIALFDIIYGSIALFDTIYEYCTILTTF